MGKRGRPPHPDILTPREWQVLDLLREDLTNEQIAHRLDISPATAKYHVSEILSKLGVTTREEAAGWRQHVPSWRRAVWPLTLPTGAAIAGIVAMAVALAGLAVLAVGWQQGDGEKQDIVDANQPTGTPEHGQTSPAAAQPSPFVENELLGQLLVPVVPATPISQGGQYVLEVATGSVWRTEWSGILSPDGRTLAVGHCCVGDGALVFIDIATGMGRRVQQGDSTPLAWSPDGSRVLFASSGGIYVVDRNGYGPIKLMEPTSGRAWSITGKRMAYISESSGQGELHVIDLDSGAVTRLASGNSMFSWSPSGDSLAYTTADGLFVYDFETSASAHIANGPISGQLDWSPDATKLLARYGEPVPFADASAASVQLVHVFDVSATLAPVALPPARFHSWSPDGSRVAYASEGCVTREWDVFTIAADGTGATALGVIPDAVKEGVTWSPDGSVIAVATADAILMVNPISHEQRVVVGSETQSAAGFIPHLHEGGWSASGQYLAFPVYGPHGVCT